MFQLSRFRLIFLAFSFVWMIFHQHILMLMNIPFEVALFDNLIFNVLLIIFSLLLSNMLMYYRPSRDKGVYVMFVSLFISAFWVLFSKWLMLHLVSVNQEYLFFLGKSLPIRFGFGVLIAAIAGYTTQLCYGFEDQNEEQTRAIDSEKLTREAELYKLRQQLQPHFLFNSLNSISALIVSRPQEARKMINQLSEFLRGTLKREDVQFVSLNEELEYLSLYLDIEKVRFGHRLETSVEVKDEVLNAKLPPMLMQPVVENAIKFGLYDTTDSVKIILNAIMKKGHLEITVTNPYDPDTANPRKGTGFGLSGIERRLFLLYHRKDLLQTQSENKLFTTKIIIPQTNDEGSIN